jgi:hypothetical protein
MARLVVLAKRSGGVLTAEQIESDADFAAVPNIASAAAHALAGSTNVFGTARDDGAGWFPYQELRFTELAVA